MQYKQQQQQNSAKTLQNKTKQNKPKKSKIK